VFSYPTIPITACQIFVWLSLWSGEVLNIFWYSDIDECWRRLCTLFLEYDNLLQYIFLKFLLLFLYEKSQYRNFCKMLWKFFDFLHLLLIKHFSFVWQKKSQIVPGGFSYKTSHHKMAQHASSHFEMGRFVMGRFVCESPGDHLYLLNIFVNYCIFEKSFFKVSAVPFANKTNFKGLTLESRLQ
jgi:hypothetical protein